MISFQMPYKLLNISMILHNSYLKKVKYAYKARDSNLDKIISEFMKCN